MRTSPKQAWPHGADPCLGTSFRQRVTTAVVARKCFSLANNLGPEGPQPSPKDVCCPYSAGVLEVENRREQLARIGLTRIFRICSKFSFATSSKQCGQKFSRQLNEVLPMRLNAASTVCRRFHCAPLAALSAVTTATLTHLHAAAPLRVSEIRKRSSSLMARARHPSIGLRCRQSRRYAKQGTEVATFCSEVAGPPNARWSKTTDLGFRLRAAEVID